MAKANVKKGSIVLTLELSEEEAKQLKAMVQNQAYSEEPASLSDVRNAIWSALTDAGVMLS